MQYTTYVQSILQGNTPFTAHIAMKGRVAQFREKSVDVLLSSVRVCVRRRSRQAILGTEHNRQERTISYVRDNRKGLYEEG